MLLLIFLPAFGMGGGGTPGVSVGQRPKTGVG